MVPGRPLESDFMGSSYLRPSIRPRVWFGYPLYWRSPRVGVELDFTFLQWVWCKWGSLVGNNTIFF